MCRTKIIVSLLVILVVLPRTMTAAIEVEDLKMKRRVGLGLTAAGPLSVLGLEVDINISEKVSLSMGLGTGLDYSTFAVRGKYFLMGEKFSPYIGGGLARWWTDGTNETNLGPSILKNKFLSGNDFSNGFDVWMLYPTVGIQYMNPTGFGLYAELQALFKIPSLANGIYSGLGALIYF